VVAPCRPAGGLAKTLYADSRRTVLFSPNFNMSINLLNLLRRNKLPIYTNPVPGIATKNIESADQKWG
jgi:hypothetical protein